MNECFFFFLQYWTFFVTGENVEVLLECSTKLLERFRYPWEMLPLMLVILKDAQADLEEASRRIAEGEKPRYFIFLFVFGLSLK